MIISYLPIFTLDLVTGTKTNVMTGESEQVAIKTELEQAKQWLESKFYFKPHHSPQYCTVINCLDIIS